MKKSFRNTNKLNSAAYSHHDAEQDGQIDHRTPAGTRNWTTTHTRQHPHKNQKTKIRWEITVPGFKITRKEALKRVRTVLYCLYHPSPNSREHRAEREICVLWEMKWSECGLWIGTKCCPVTAEHDTGKNSTSGQP